MSPKQNITDVLMVGATGSIGRLAVAAAERHGLRPRALVRDVRRAERLLPGVELVQADLEDTAALRRAVDGADAVVLTHGSGCDPETRRRVDYGGVRNLLRALDGARPRVALMTSVHATRSDIPGNSPWKRALRTTVARQWAALHDRPARLVRPRRPRVRAAVTHG
jgi:uncharacterized protein YbjT (DUF2867 family)